MKTARCCWLDSSTQKDQNNRYPATPGTDPGQALPVQLKGVIYTKHFTGDTDQNK